MLSLIYIPPRSCLQLLPHFCLLSFIFVCDDLSSQVTEVSMLGKLVKDYCFCFITMQEDVMIVGKYYSRGLNNLMLVEDNVNVWLNFTRPRCSLADFNFITL